jgi:hypothetical protein
MKRSDACAIAVVVVAAFGFLLSDSVGRYWSLHARLNLLLGGCFFCHVESASNLENVFPRPSEFVSKLVYKDGVYVGYLNRYGIFVSNANIESSGGTPEAFRRDLKVVALTVYLKFLSAGIFLVASIYWLCWMIRYHRGKNRGHI